MLSHPISNRFVTPEVILNAYYQGLFPMANERGEIGFYVFEPRGIVPLDGRFHVRRSVRQVLKKKNFQVTFDTAPLEVLRGCARVGVVPAYQLWLSDELMELYLRLFEMGRMHTVEVWEPSANFGGERQLLGGLYGITFGGAFCGESMFSRTPFASQIALVHLVEHLRQHGFTLLDAQMSSEHLKQFGLYECSQQEYLDYFYEAAEVPVTF